MKKTCLFLWPLFFLCISCQTDESLLKVQKSLSQAEFMMESDPDSAFGLLNRLDSSIVQRSTRLSMEHKLLLANAQNRSDKPMMSLGEILPVVAYYEKNGPDNRKMLSYYLAGRICVIQQESPMAMSYFQQVLLLAENTDEDDDYMTLYRTHTQMAETFHRQKVYTKAAEESSKAAETALAHGDTTSYLIAKEITIRPLNMLGRYDDVISLSEECAQEYMKRGNHRNAVLARQNALKAYIARERYDEAEAIMHDYEELPGIFDANGKIAAGREIYFYKRGLLYLKTGKTKAAEENFRELIAHPSLNNCEAAYSGLLQLYKNLGISDSASKYAQLYCEMHDSVYKQMATQDVILMESQFNYERNRIRAEKKMQDAANMQIYLYQTVILSIVGCVLLTMVILMMRRLHKRKETYMRITHQQKENLMNERLTRMNALANTFSQNLDSLVEQMNAKSMNAKEIAQIIQSAEENGGLIARIKDKLSCYKKDVEIISSEDYGQLMRYAEVKFPKLYETMGQAELSDKDCLAIVLIRLGFADQEIRKCMNITPSGFVNRKNRITQKLFPESTMKCLHENISSFDQDNHVESQMLQDDLIEDDAPASSPII